MLDGVKNEKVNERCGLAEKADALKFGVVEQVMMKRWASQLFFFYFAITILQFQPASVGRNNVKESEFCSVDGQLGRKGGIVSEGMIGSGREHVVIGNCGDTSVMATPSDTVGAPSGSNAAQI